MNRNLILAMITLFIICNSVFSQQVPNPNSNPVYDFLNKEKFRDKIEKAIERYNNSNNQKSLKNDSLNYPELMDENGEVVVSKDKIPESEVHAAINPNNPQNMVISAIKQVQSGSDQITCPVYYSIDGGDTWTKSAFISKPIIPGTFIVFAGGDPVLIFDRNGVLHFSWINCYLTKTPNLQYWDSVHVATFWATSSNNGRSFEFTNNNFIEKNFATKFNNSYSFNELLDKQWMATGHSDATMYLSCVYINPTMLSKPIIPKIFRKLPNQSQYEPKGTEINIGNLYIVQFGSIDVDLNDNVHYVFYGSNEYVQDLYHCVSKDKGLTFSNPYRITALMGAMEGMPGTQSVVGLSESRIYPSPYMVVDKSNSKFKNNIYVTWTGAGIINSLGNGLDIYFTKSTNGGKVWSTPKIVNNDKLRNIHNFYSNIAVNESGVIAITYYDRRNYIDTNYIGLTDFYLSLSYDGGETFSDYKISSTPSKFSEIGKSNGSFGIGEYNQVMISKDYVYPVWADGRTNNGDINIYFSKFKINQDSIQGLEDINPVSGLVKIEELNPNPANENIKIVFSSKVKSTAILEIYDITGKSLLSANIGETVIGNNQTSINVSSLASATYFAKITIDNVYSVKQFHVSR